MIEQDTGRTIKYSGRLLLPAQFVLVMLINKTRRHVQNPGRYQHIQSMFRLILYCLWVCVWGVINIKTLGHTTFILLFLYIYSAHIK